MANTDTPCGLRPYGEVLRIRYYRKDASAAAIGRGSVVKLEADGSIALAAPTDTGLLGVSQKYSANATADASIPVMDHPMQQYVIQDDNSATSSQAIVGANADFTTDTVNTTTGLSIMELAVDGVSNSDGELRVLGLADTIYPDGAINAWGANADIIVMINEHTFKATAGI